MYVKSYLHTASLMYDQIEAAHFTAMGEKKERRVNLIHNSSTVEYFKKQNSYDTGQDQV